VLLVSCRERHVRHLLFSFPRWRCSQRRVSGVPPLPPSLFCGVLLLPFFFFFSSLGRGVNSCVSLLAKESEACTFPPLFFYSPFPPATKRDVFYLFFYECVMLFLSALPLSSFSFPLLPHAAMEIPILKTWAIVGRAPSFFLFRWPKISAPTIHVVQNGYSLTLLPPPSFFSFPCFPFSCRAKGIASTLLRNRLKTPLCFPFLFFFFFLSDSPSRTGEHTRKQRPFTKKTTSTESRRRSASLPLFFFFLSPA